MRAGGWQLWARRLAWLAGLWLASVAVLFAAASLLKFAMRAAGLAA